MEKTKCKNSPVIVQRRLTILLSFILGLSVFFYFFPLIITWEYAFFDLPLQTYALLPLLSLPLGIWFFRLYGFSKRNLLLIVLCLLLAISTYQKLALCPTGFYPTFNRLAFFEYFAGCGWSWALF